MYQQVMNAILYDMLGHYMEVYIDNIVPKSKKANDPIEHLKKRFESIITNWKSIPLNELSEYVLKIF